MFLKSIKLPETKSGIFNRLAMGTYIFVGFLLIMSDVIIDPLINIIWLSLGTEGNYIKKM